MALQDLQLKRSSVKGRITKFKNYLLTLEAQLSQLTSLQLAELNLKVDKFGILATRFDTIQSEIEVLNSDNLDFEIDEREGIEEDIVSCLARVKILIDSNIRADSKPVVTESQCHHSHSGQSSGPDFKLPKIEISKFDGSYFRWTQFRDAFLALVDKNDRISDIHKFHYLISYLEHDAARVISNLEVSSSNYKNAWSLLCARYDNKRVLINHHLTALFNIQPITRESERSLRFLVDHVSKNLRALSSLGQPTDKWDILLVFMLSSKLDNNTLMKWEELRNTLDELPTLIQFNKFLTDRADVLEALNRTKHDKHSAVQHSTSRQNQDHNKQYLKIQNIGKQNTNSNSKFPFVKTFSSTHQYKQNKIVCVICKNAHRIYDCSLFKEKSISDRLADIRKHSLCSNCLRPGHQESECRLGPCKVCNKRHNTMLHSDSPPTVSSFSVPAESVVTFSKESPNEVMLSTAVIEVSNPLNHVTETVRALLDCGSQSSFITENLKQKLQLTTNTIDTINVIGIGNSSCNKVIESSTIHIQSKNNSYNVNLPCLVLKQLTGKIPRAPINRQNFNLPSNIKLADPNFATPAQVDVLLGADIFWDVISPERFSMGPKKPKLINSKFGWLVAGPIHACSAKHIQCNHTFNHSYNQTYKQTDNTISNHTSNHTIKQSDNDTTNITNQSLNYPLDVDRNIENILTKFWEVEEVPIKSHLSHEESLCEEHFLINTTRLDTGRFCVRLPLKDNPDCLGESYSMAKKRLLTLEKRFRKHSNLKSQYTEFIREYAKLGHLSISPNPVPVPGYFLCHHAVFRDSSESTKLRVVFDGSAPTFSGFSLNDILMVGPNVQDSLFSILIRARQHRYLLTGDIEKMYRQVEVHPDDRNLQLILWREDDSLPIQTLRLNVLTYGTASAAHLSTRCLWQIGEECGDDEIRTIIQRDFYVDDLITGASSIQKLRFIQKSVAEALKSAGFPLRKYKSNVSNLFHDIENHDSTNKLILSESSSTLGLGWNPTEDYLHFPIKSIDIDNSNITKRSIMSNAFKIFDPLGLLSPSIIQIKMILQKLWLLKLDWDVPVPQDIEKSWNEFVDGTRILVNFKIPRTVICDTPIDVEIHSFSDASKDGFGACVYLKSTNANNDVSINLLCAKSKVTPLKPLTIPRAELCAALLSAKLTKSVVDATKNKPIRVTYWCDSSVVLAWLQTPPRNLKTFVANRIVEIIELTHPSRWRYVPTRENPADLISRGISAKQLIDSNLWWHGPKFLVKNEKEWPSLKPNKNKNDLPETKSIEVHSVVAAEPLVKIENYSDFTKLQRIFAYVKRYIFNLRNRLNKRFGFLTTDELQNSFKHLCFIAQLQSFPAEHKMLKKNLPLNRKSKLLSLSPFLDKDNLIRVGGRIDASKCAYERKHPIVLDASHHLTKLFFKREHIRLLHSGPQLLLATVRETIWPINGRRLARNTVHSCVKCRRFQGKTLCPKMGNLPVQRVTPDFPFLSVGLDFAGPFLILNRKGRGSKLIKCYLCLFVCMRYKCVHLEAVSSLSKDDFIMALRRFISRRGKPAEIFSDNGRNFVAAAKELGSFLKLNNFSLSEFAAQEGIKFSFIPVYSPHFGGIWESGIKAAKHFITRAIGNCHLTFEEIQTLFTQVEAILNSRPLCPMSSNPDDLLSLSPGHFLIGRPLTTFPSPTVQDANPNNLLRYQRLEQIRQHFWARWQREYISELQSRQKWTKECTPLNVGDLVLIKEDYTPPLCWSLGRVEKLYSGPDNICRVADVNTSRGCVRRSLVRLCPLPKPEVISC